jgi:ankyrin repeat protein
MIAGRTPLHLAVMSSSSAIVRILIDHGARLVARLADGRTALHLATARGNVEMVKMILEKSEANEEEEAQKEDVRKKARMNARESKNADLVLETKSTASHDEESDLEVVENEEDESDEDDEGVRSTTTGSFVKVKEAEKKVEEFVPEEEEDEPDVYDVNVLTWDTKCSPLHYAILGGHIDVVKELVQNHGADVLLPIKLLNDHDKSPRGAILTLILALNLSLEKSKAMIRTLLELGASSAQADTKQKTALHYISNARPEILETLVQFDEPSVKRAINHLAVSGSQWSPSATSPLMSAISKKNSLAALKLLEAGAAAEIEFKDWLKSVEAQYDSVHSRNSNQNKSNFQRDIEQPIVLAVREELPDVVTQLLERGADPNTLPKQTQQQLENTWCGFVIPNE